MNKSNPFPALHELNGLELEEQSLGKEIRENTSWSISQAGI